MDKRYQVFISSTFSDLEAERKLVMEAILECNCFPAGMEMFPALDMDQFEYIKAIIDKCDYYILIVAGRYGSLASDGIGYTEKEYKYALEKNIPVLVFVKKDIENIPANHTDQDSNLKKKLVKFRDEIMGKRLGKMWDDKYELQSKISLSLRAAIELNPRTGWIRADKIEKEKEKEIEKQIEIEIEEPNSELYAKLENEMELDVYLQNQKFQIKVRLIDFIIIIGGPEKPIWRDDYVMIVNQFIHEKIISSQDLLKRLLVSTEGFNYSLNIVHKKLKYMNLVKILSDGSDIYTIELTELGEEIYKKVILNM